MTTKTILANILATTALAFGIGASRAVAAQSPDDRVLASKVVAVLIAEPELVRERIGVETRNGVVTLKGKVAGDPERIRAIALASSVEGVRRVDSGLELRPER